MPRSSTRTRVRTGSTIAVRLNPHYFLLLLVVAVCLIMPASRAHADPVTGDKYTFVVYGDVRSHPDDHRKIVTDIIKMHPEFVIITGDLVNVGTSQAEWDEYNRIVKPFADANIPLYTVEGNHDVGLYSQYSTKLPDATGAGNYYAFTLHGSRFIVLDNFDPGGLSPGSRQYTWLKGELASADKHSVNTFVTFHVPPYSVGAHGPNLQLQHDIVPLFAKYHVRAVFCGHDHNYYRTIRDGVLYLVSGGGGAPLYDADNAATAIAGDVYAAVHNYILCQVNGTKLRCLAYAVDHDPTSPSPWFIGSAKTNAVVTVATENGPDVSIIPSIPGGPVIDRVTVGGAAADQPVR